MPKVRSLDPRINRLGIDDDLSRFEPEEPLEQWPTYEVFVQPSRGDQHQHVGAVHAPTPEMALVFAKEQFARRLKCANIWVVRTKDIYYTAYEDEDMFKPGVDKSYREAFGYKETRKKIEQFKKQQS